LVDTQRIGRHRQAQQDKRCVPVRRRRVRLWVTTATICIAVAIVAAFAAYDARIPGHTGHSAPQQHAPATSPSYALATSPSSYIGLYPQGVPDSYAPVEAFTTATGVQPDVVVYYSGWLEPFQVGFVTTAANEGATPLVQMNPTHASVSAIAAGRYDSYLRTYARAVHAYRHPIILSFGHEMNGYWYSWGNTHTSPASFVAAWRHIVTIFRASGAQNVTWLWTINTIHKKTRVPPPGPWWPGSSYVNWVGIDGYYTSSSSVFASVFGPTIVNVRSLTRKPILISETSVTPASSQPEKIADLFAGIRLYGLLGFVWFDSVGRIDWRLTNPAAIAAFRRDAEVYQRTAS
jgi:mannan endo-1,4-beta-mannosidase